MKLAKIMHPTACYKILQNYKFGDIDQQKDHKWHRSGNLKSIRGNYARINRTIECERKFTQVD